MCLTVKRFSKVKKAKKDIVVYKRAIPYSDFYYTPFMFEKIEINSLLSIDNNIKKIRHGWVYVVEEGFHSYKNFKDIKYFSTIFKCIIPKGSYYITGSFGGDKSIVSNQIIYKDLIKN